MEKKDWRTVEVDFRLVRMLLYTLKEEGILDETEIRILEEQLLAAWHPLLGELERDM